jgi:phytoene dehydrogenase-like protein
MIETDIIIVGSGINSLVCAGLLAKAGKKVLVLERNDRPGGCIRTDDITVPGFTHDVLSGFHPLFVTSPGYAELASELHARGLEYVHAKAPTAVILPDNRSLIMAMSRQANIAALNAVTPGDGDGYHQSLGELEHSLGMVFGLLGGELWRWSTVKLMAGEVRRRGLHGVAGFFGGALSSCRQWLETSVKDDLSKALFAPWILHTGLGPEAPLSGLMGQLIAFTLEQAGMPIVKGGSQRLVDAFASYLSDQGSRIICNADVASVIVEKGVARGVTTADGQSFRAGDAVVCNVTPTQLYGRFLSAEHAPPVIKTQAGNYRYGRGCMQIHIALDEPPAWPDPALKDVAMIHVTPGLNGVSRAVNEADRGLLPAEATIVVAQPMAADPSRAPKGKWILWVQLQELPKIVKGDALGEITIPADGRWTDALKESYADRIIDRLARHIPNLKASILGRTVLSPADLEALNMNLVGGDPYSGDCAIDQFLLWRPLRGLKNHKTPVRNLYHIGASTHPGPGLGGGSGYMVAKALA